MEEAALWEEEGGTGFLRLDYDPHTQVRVCKRKGKGEGGGETLRQRGEETKRQIKKEKERCFCAWTIVPTQVGSDSAVSTTEGSSVVANCVHKSSIQPDARMRCVSHARPAPLFIAGIAER